MTLCIYHGGCTDGVAAAWAVWEAIPDCEFYPGIYQQDPPLEKAEGKDVILVDFSYKKPVMERLCEKAKSVLVLDHHKTAMNDLFLLLDSGMIKGQFDMDRCGSMMAWDYFHSEPRPLLLTEIDKQDRWLPDRDSELIMALRSYAHKPQDETKESWELLMAQWSAFMTDEGVQKLRKDGQAIYRWDSK